jgi:hypothetical protein
MRREAHEQHGGDCEDCEAFHFVGRYVRGNHADP